MSSDASSIVENIAPAEVIKETLVREGSGDYAIPNFRADAKAREEYKTQLERRTRDYIDSAEADVRRTFAIKREALRIEMNAAQMILDSRRAEADAALRNYKARYPHRIKKDRTQRPSFFENLASFGKAGKLHKKALDALHAANDAASNQRRLEHADEQLDADMMRGIARATENAKATVTSEPWLKEAHEKAPLSRHKAKVDEIAKERAAYAERLERGAVSAEEMRDRSFAEHDVNPIDLPLNGLMFYRVDIFKALCYFIIRDVENRFYALPYDPRLESIIDGVFDIYRVGNAYEVRQRVQEESKLPFTLLDHFFACSDGQDIVAREAYRQQRRWMRDRKPASATPSERPIEDETRRLLAEFAVTIPSPRAPDIR